MPRTARLDAPGALHHVMIRGIERRKIFRNNNVEKLKRYRFCGHGALMGKTKRKWQDTGYVLAYFGKKLTEARKKYESFVKEGMTEGRREGLTGGGLIRSLGGWTAARDVLRSGVHTMSDEQILGDSDFVDAVIS